MAKKKETFADMLKSLQERKIEAKPVATIEERRYFLIVCEGTRTEPLYFEYLKKLLPNHLLETVEIVGLGQNTTDVVKKAIELRDNRLEDKINPPFDEVWAVFDKDDFPPRRFNSAVSLANINGIESGHSNQAFELWYVLHFQYLDTALKRTDYFDRMKKLLNRNYEKNDENVVSFLFEKGNVRLAIERGEKLRQLHGPKTPSQACPYTRIHILVKRLLTYSRHRAIVG